MVTQRVWLSPCLVILDPKKLGRRSLPIALGEPLAFDVDLSSDFARPEAAGGRPTQVFGASPKFMGKIIEHIFGCRDRTPEKRNRVCIRHRQNLQYCQSRLLDGTTAAQVL